MQAGDGEVLSEEDVKLAQSGLAALAGWLAAHPTLAMTCLNLPGAPPSPPAPSSQTFHRVGSVRGSSHCQMRAKARANQHECQQPNSLLYFVHVSQGIVVRRKATWCCGMQGSARR